MKTAAHGAQKDRTTYYNHPPLLPELVGILPTLLHALQSA